ncbi:MAG TPA: hypothetical protein PKD55_14065 [Bellilinea sp.]|nr:hypothetical protein [Bellilinea sp.]
MNITNMNQQQFLLIMATAVLVIGVLLLVIGVVVLVSRVLGGEIKRIAENTAELAQKGIAEEVAGLVGNATTLVDSLNSLIRSSAGVGVFLILVGIVFLAASYGLALRLH